MQRLILRRSGTDRRCDDAVAAAESRIERAVCVVADQREILPGNAGVAGDEDLAVRLQGDTRADVGGVEEADGRNRDAAVAERRVERTVRVIARDREILVRR